MVDSNPIPEEPFQGLLGGCVEAQELDAAEPSTELAQVFRGVVDAALHLDGDLLLAQGRDDVGEVTFPDRTLELGPVAAPLVVDGD